MNEVKLNYPPEYYEDIPKDKFICVQSGQIFDEAFQTKPVGFFKDVFLRFCKNKASIASLIIICFIVVMAIVGPNMNPYTYREQNLELADMPPRVQGLEWMGLFDGSSVLKSRRVDSLSDPAKYPEGCVIRVFNEKEIRGIKTADVEVDYYKYKGLGDDVNFWFGTDNYGRDIWTRLWRGVRVSLIIAVVAVVAELVIGIIYGAISGYYGGKVDMVMMRICEIVRSVPNVIVCTMFMMMLGAGMGTMIIALVVRGWVPTARLIRTQFLRFKNREYVMAARTMGVPDRKLIFRHILPNAIGPIITRAMVAIPGAIFMESFLAYIGLGLPTPEPSIGTMLADAQGFLLIYPTQTLFPALLISVLMIAFNLCSNGLRDAFDPTQRGTE